MLLYKVMDQIPPDVGPKLGIFRMCQSGVFSEIEHLLPMSHSIRYEGNTVDVLLLFWYTKPSKMKENVIEMV